MKNKLAMIILSCIIVGALGFCVVWTIVNFNKVKDGISGTSLYTKDDLESAYGDGYNTAFKDKNDYIIEMEQLRTLLSEKETKLLELENYVAECETRIQDLTIENNNLRAEIRRLETIIENLRASIRAYEELIASMPVIEERFVVTFMFDDTVYSIVLVPDGEKVQIETPISTEYTIFLGWSLSQDGEIIDISELEITSDTVIYAKIIRKYDVNFVHDFKIHEHQIIEKGHFATPSAPASTDRRVFLGWSLDGVNIVDPATVPIYEHRTFYSVVETRHEVKFVYTRNSPYVSTTVIDTQYVKTAENIEIPEAPTFDGYSFSKWLINGDENNVYSSTDFTLAGDTVLVALYTPILLGKSTNYTCSSSTSEMGRIKLTDFLAEYGGDYITSFSQLEVFRIEGYLNIGTVQNRFIALNLGNSSTGNVGFQDTSNASGNFYYNIGITSDGYLQFQIFYVGASLTGHEYKSGSFRISNFTAKLKAF